MNVFSHEDIFLIKSGTFTALLIIAIVVAVVSAIVLLSDRSSNQAWVVICMVVVFFSSMGLFQIHNNHSSNLEKAIIQDRAQEELSERQKEEEYKLDIQSKKSKVESVYDIDLIDEDVEKIFNAHDKDMVRQSTNQVVVVRHLDDGSVALFDPRQREVPLKRK